jgi:YVTN family beta-propeller protein
MLEKRNPTLSLAFWLGLLFVTAASGQSIVATIAMPADPPEAIAINPVRSRLYAVGQFWNNVTVVDTSNNSVITVIPSGSPTSPYGDWPDDIRVSPDGHRVYVANGALNRVTVINADDNTVQATISGSDFNNPCSLALSPDGSKLYVANAGSWKVMSIDTTTLQVTSTFPVWSHALARTMAVHPTQPLLYLASGWWINASTNAAGMLPASGFRLAIAPDGSRLYVHDQFSNKIAVITTADKQLVARIDVPSSGGDPEVIIVTPNGAKVYATHSGDKQVTAIATATNSITKTFSFQLSPPPPLVQPVGLAASPDGSTVFVVTTTAVHFVDVLTDTIRATVPVGSNSVAGEAPVLNPSGSRLYLANTYGIAVIDTGISNFVGFLPPIRNDGSSIFQSGRTVPVKFQLTTADGGYVTNATATLQVLKLTDTVLGTVVEVTADASGSSNTGNLFRFDATANQYVYNLSIKGYSSGTYLLRVRINDQTTHEVQISIR